METLQQRLIDERDALYTKFDALTVFLRGDAFEDATNEQRLLLKKQHHLLKRQHRTLCEYIYNRYGCSSS